MVFTDEFHEASGFEKAVHLTAVLLTVSSTVLLTAPAAWHRLLFRTGNRERILTYGNRSVLVGLGCLAAAISTTVALIAKVVYGPVAMAILGVVSAALFVGMWFVVPRLIDGNGD
ncbi:hypothetical protein C791_8501 [Amycolatopsis azurea DSM 43854]|uniref:Uncharacterized protein n=1 Tax=Amycolatopsis azurea DSM 43854 TaxID=1238180 RepID=M2PSF4_9PSEU|nr:hypothetical protein C791_8501 [Amycolatopsis azurea DSM 43854]